MRLGQQRVTGFSPGSLMISLGMHALLAALVLYAGGLQKPAAAPVLTVSLVSAAPLQPGLGGEQGTPAAGSGRAAPLEVPKAPPKKKPAPNKPPRKKAPAYEAAEPEKSAAVLPLRPTAPLPVKAPPPPAKTALVAPPSTSGVSSLNPGGAAAGTAGAAGPSRAGLGGGGGPGSGGSGGGGDGKGDGRALAQVQRHYLNLIRTRILAKRSYPLLARQRRQEGTVRLRFTLSPAGRLAEGVQVVKPSGFELLDEQARQCVLAAAPFPPFPEELKRPSLTVELPIVYKLTELGI